MVSNFVLVLLCSVNVAVIFLDNDLVFIKWMGAGGWVVAATHYLIRALDAYRERLS